MLGQILHKGFTVWDITPRIKLTKIDEEKSY
jgi:hypothetical protein